MYMDGGEVDQRKEEVEEHRNQKTNGLRGRLVREKMD